MKLSSSQLKAIPVRLPRKVTGWLALLSGLLALSGLLLVLGYCLNVAGPHLQYFAVAVTAAIASLLTGCLAGFLFGIPRVVSTGALRLGRSGTVTDKADAEAPTGQFSPSTNLSEISDWLTKLLLGAGLVQLGNLARAAEGLVQAVAGGMTGTPAEQFPATHASAMAGAILVTYAVLGFLDGYVVTTLWYGRRLSELAN